VGSGGTFLDAEYNLKASVPAGTYKVICDGIIIRAVDVTFSLLHRRGDTDVELGTWMQHFEPLGGGQFDAQPCEHDVEAPTISFRDGDQLVFRYQGANTTASMAYIPNGDGAVANGRIPNITLPR
jgi:hypothetical protein